MSDKMETTVSGSGYGVKPPWPGDSNVSGFVTPFEDALVKVCPTTGPTTGSLPKP